MFPFPIYNLFKNILYDNNFYYVTYDKMYIKIRLQFKYYQQRFLNLEFVLRIDVQYYKNNYITNKYRLYWQIYNMSHITHHLYELEYQQRRPCYLNLYLVTTNIKLLMTVE